MIDYERAAEMQKSDEYALRLKQDELHAAHEKITDLQQQVANLRSDLTKLLDGLEQDLVNALSKLRSFQVFKN